MMKRKSKMVKIGILIVVCTYTLLTLCSISQSEESNFCPAPDFYESMRRWFKAEDEILVNQPSAPITTRATISWPSHINHCPNLTTPPIFPHGEPQTFQKVTDRKVFVFSAYFERRPEAEGPSVRVIAGGYQVQFNTIGPMYCQLWYENRNTPFVIEGRYKVIYRSIGHADMWTAHFIMCGLPAGVSDIPAAVSVSPLPCALPSNQLMILNREEPDPQPTFGVCLSAIYGRYKDWVGIAEMFEMYTLLGASEIVIYNLSLSHDTDIAMKAYLNDPTKNVRAVQWPLPVKEMHKTSTFFQRGALNDCLYRLSQRHRFVAVHDIDEVMVPRMATTWKELFDEIYDPKRAIYMFQHSYFRRNTSKDDPYMITQASFQTTKEVLPAGKIRCKSLYNARLVRSIDVHYHYDLMPGSQEYMIPPQIAKLHHYRISYMETFRKDPSIEFIEDRYMERYKAQLQHNLKVSVDKIKSMLKVS